MKHSDQDIKKAIDIIAAKGKAPITRHCDGFIVMAQSEGDFIGKVNRIRRGETFGFYTVEHALKL